MSKSVFGNNERKNEPEFAELFDRFALEEVPGTGNIDKRYRYLAILAALLGCGGKEIFQNVVPLALEEGISPVEITEVVYQSAAYLGIGKVYPFLEAVSVAFEKAGIEMPLEKQGTTTPENRRERGTQTQIELFGPGMSEFWKKSDINRFLADNCFGDYYTRKGLCYRERELITFCFLAAAGGCEPQLGAHTAANFVQGNDADFLTGIVYQLVPYIGYPRSLNAISVIRKTAEKN